MLNISICRKLHLLIALTCYATVSGINSRTVFAQESRPVVLFKNARSSDTSIKTSGTFVKFKDPVKNLYGSAPLKFTIRKKKYLLKSIYPETVQRLGGTYRNVINAEVTEAATGTPKGYASFALSRNSRRLVAANIILKDAGSFSLKPVRRSKLYSCNKSPDIAFTKEPGDFEVPEKSRGAISDLKISCAYNAASLPKYGRLSLLTRSNIGSGWNQWRNDNLTEVRAATNFEFSTGGYPGEAKQYLCRLIDFRSGVTIAQSRVGTSVFLTNVSDPINPPPITPTPLPQSAKWQNPLNPRDVNGDGRVNPSDLLMVINYLLSEGDPADLPAGTPTKYFDVNGDNKVSEADSNLIIAYLKNLP